jgi:L-lactate dehydrogenase complex protein LldF
MHVASMHFKPRAAEALGDATLQSNLEKFNSTGFTALRARAVADFGADLFEKLRGEGAAIRDRGLANLDAWIERFESEATRRGASVLFAETREEACELLLDICRRHGVKKVIKSKSMLSEEAGINEALEAAGVTPVETDLAVSSSSRREPPSHIIAPALHKNKDEVADRGSPPRAAQDRHPARDARGARGVALALPSPTWPLGRQFPDRRKRLGRDRHQRGNGRMVTTPPRVHA